MSHNDVVSKLPKGFKISSSTKDCGIASMEDDAGRLFGTQFHPEVTHTKCGKRLFENFVYNICKCKQSWTMKSFVEKSIEEIKNKVGSEHVVLGLSGGVDSSVACAILLKQGYEVEAVFMKNWTPKSEAEGMLMCPLKADEKDARVVASQLGLKFSTVSFEKDYRRDVVDYLFKEYKEGRTPNPDILCNSKIKFKAFLEHALKRGADFVATGHYVRKICDTRFAICDTRYRLLKGIDSNKDQSYFLYQITQDQLKHCLFPIGDYQKPEIRKLAKKYGLITENKPDSQGICFVGEVVMAKFLKQRIKPKIGDIITIDGKKIGEHEGVWYYTIGQRRGIGVGGSPRLDKNEIRLSRSAKDMSNVPRWAKVEAGGMPYYVIEKNIKKNQLIVARGDQDEPLFKKKLLANKVSWIAGDMPKFPLKCRAKIRYRQADQDCIVSQAQDSRYTIKVAFKEKQRAITPGQFIVFYQKDICLGGGKII
jgi:tRNA-specific 2-thiouridylase